MVRRTEVVTVLRQRLLSGLHLGLLRPGGKLPTVRELGRELNADPRVVLAAYRLLEEEGLVELRQRSGIYFAPAGHITGSELANRAEWVTEAVVQGLVRGIPVPEFPERMQRYLETLRLRAACIECNADQIASLAAELSTDYGLEVSGVEVDALAGGDLPLQELRRADLLVTTQFHAGLVRDVAERIGKPWVAASLRVDIFAEIARLLPKGPVCFVVTDPRYAAKLDGIFANVAGGSNLRVLVEGRDDLAHVPDHAPAYMTRAARERITDRRLLDRVMPETRAFSVESAREILTFVIRANMAAMAARGS